MNRKIILKSRPEKEPLNENFQIIEEDLNAVQPGQVQLKSIYLSLDPYMRGRMNAGRSYAKPVELGTVMEGEAVSEVIESNSDTFKKGDIVIGRTGWQTMPLVSNKIIEKVLERHEKEPIKLNSLEGFIRQVIGWREFIRGIYQHRGTEQRNSNFWKFKNKLPESFYDGTTGILPVDNVIKNGINDSYSHHIERLMIMGNIMMLLEIDPNQAYKWFMEIYIDSYDWVMVPNIYGMSQFSDNGLMASKPYISSSKYILKMSDYKYGDWCEIWDALYWRFITVSYTHLTLPTNREV